MDLSRTHVFDLVTGSLDRYSQDLHCEALQIFVINMLREHPDGLSNDPALLDSFERLAPAEFASPADALLATANFIDEEVVRVWKIDEGRLIANDFRAAAAFPEHANHIIRGIFYN